MDNLKACREGQLFLAGGHQFQTAWLRDYCHSVPGLLSFADPKLIDNQLKLFFLNRDKNAWLPRGMDVVRPQTRVIFETAFKGLGNGFRRWQKNKGLYVEYFGEHGTRPFDSNLLFLMAVASYTQKMAGQRPHWFYTTAEDELIKPYFDHIEKGLLQQPEFSDWQDSSRRSGSLALTHLYFLKVLSLYPSFEKRFGSLLSWQTKIMDTFYDKDLGLFCEFTNSAANKHISLDTQLFAIKNPQLFPELDMKDLWKQLKAHPLYKLAASPGVPIYPQYPIEDISWTTQFVGLGHYHDGFVWGWLAAETVSAAKAVSDITEAQRLTELWQMQMNFDGAVYEIYEATDLANSEQGPLMPVQRPLYRSESPFSWTAAKWLEALSANKFN